MVTITSAKSIVSKLLGIRPIDVSQSYRLMKYVIAVDVSDGLLLENLVTGQLVLLSKEEQIAIDNLPGLYDSILDELIKAFFVVPKDFCEYVRVNQLRAVLQKIEDSKKKAIRYFTILPTTACNARCFYCFEAGIATTTMTETTAKAVVSYIKNNCAGESVKIRWFGGEPTVGHRIIDIISQGLESSNIDYASTMISNGYLFDEKMVERAKNSWHLKQIQITLDGTEKTYNKVKSYVNVQDNPFKRVVENIGYLLNNSIKVNIRMNVDRYNEQDLRSLLAFLYERFKGTELLSVYAWPLFGDCGYDPVHHDENDNSWLSQKIVELNQLSLEYGFYRNPSVEMPYLRFSCCMADNDATIVIRPGGELTRCLERFENEEVVGTVFDGITDFKLYADWKNCKQLEMCKECCYYPLCVRLKHCKTNELCFEKDKYSLYKNSIKNYYLNLKEKR